MLAQRTCTSSSRVTCVTVRHPTLRYAPLHRPFEALPSRSTVSFSTSTCSTATMSGSAMVQNLKHKAWAPRHDGHQHPVLSPAQHGSGSHPALLRNAKPIDLGGCCALAQPDGPDGKCCSARPLHTRAQSLRSAQAGQRQRRQPAATPCPQTTAARPAPGAHQTCVPPACLMDAATTSKERPAADSRKPQHDHCLRRGSAAAQSHGACIPARSQLRAELQGLQQALEHALLQPAAPLLHKLELPHSRPQAHGPQRARVARGQRDGQP